jgi:hypothetical protein|tara:strand:- start:22 stop:567 length:546 start_codon:yes stop_codon:yes gene_type:complete
MEEQMQQQQMQQGAGAPSPEQAMQSMEQERMAQIESIAAASPQIEKSIKSSLVKKLVSEVNKLIGKIDDSMTEVEYSPSESKLQGQFPPEVFVPIVVIFSFISTLGADFQKYMMDPSELGSEAGIRKATAMLKKMAGDKQLLARMQQPMEEEAEEQPVDMEAPNVQPSEMDEDDQAMMGMM